MLPNSSKILIAVLISVLLTAVIAGGIFYWWSKVKVKEVQTDFDGKYNTLQSQLTNLQKSVVGLLGEDTNEDSIGSVATTFDQAQYDYSNWETYTNEEFGYTVKYPDNCQAVENETNKSVEFQGPLEGGDYWPRLFIISSDSDFYHPESGTDVKEWVKNMPHDQVGAEVKISGIDAIQYITNLSPQSFASDDFYFIKDTQLYQIQLLHTGDKKDWNLYNQFLASFQFN